MSDPESARECVSPDEQPSQWCADSGSETGKLGVQPPGGVYSTDMLAASSSSLGASSTTVSYLLTAPVPPTAPATAATAALFGASTISMSSLPKAKYTAST